MPPAPAPPADLSQDLTRARTPEALPPSLRVLLDGGGLDLPHPGGGGTQERLDRLRALGRDDLVVARLAEAHTDALAVLADLGGDAGEPGALWGVWAADPPAVPLRAVLAGGAWTLTGPKPWCSGATVCDRALVTAHAEDGYRLFALDPGHPGVAVRASAWATAGMAGSGTRDLDLDGVPAVAVGGPGAYLDRPGFWWGGAGVAAVWLGGAERVAGALVRTAARHRADLVLASLGRVDAALHAARATLSEVARLADADAEGHGEGGGEGEAAGTRGAVARLAAARARAAVETAVEVTLAETGRAAGPAPLVTDAEHARHVADLQVYVRQSHGDRDLAVLGGLVLDAGGSGHGPYGVSPARGSGRA